MALIYLFQAEGWALDWLKPGTKPFTAEDVLE